MPNLATNLAENLATNLATNLADGGGGGGLVPDAFTAGQWDLNGTSTVGALEADVNALPADNGDPITAVQYRVDGGVATAFSPALPGTGIREIPGLNADSFDEHDIEIRAVNGIGPGPWSDVKSKNPPIAGLLSFAQILRLKTASPDYLTIDGSTNVEVVADATNPADSDRWYTQTTAGSRPAFVATSSLPSGVPAIQGDGLDDIMTNTTDTGLFAALAAGNSYTKYVLFDHNVGSTQTLVGEGPDNSLGSVSFAFRPLSNDVQMRHSTGQNVTDSGPMWGWLEYDQPTTTMSIATNDVAGSPSSRPDAALMELSSVCARLATGGALSEFCSEPLSVYAIFSGVLSPSDRTSVEAILAALGGL